MPGMQRMCLHLEFWQWAGRHHSVSLPCSVFDTSRETVAVFSEPLSLSLPSIGTLSWLLLGLLLKSGNVPCLTQCPCLPQPGQCLLCDHAKRIHSVLDPTTQTLDWKGDSFSSQTASATYDSPPQSASHMSQQIFHTFFPLKQF